MEIVEENDRFILAKYKNCEIFINFRDILEIRKEYMQFQFVDCKIIYLTSFECNMLQGKKGNGRILLTLLLEYIKNTRFKSENIFISLIVSGKKRIDEAGEEIQSDDTKLIQYYTKLGFRIINKDNDIMVGRLPFILSSCESYRGGRTSRNKRAVGQIKKTSRYNRKK